MLCSTDKPIPNAALRGKELIVLHMPHNGAFHGRLVYVNHSDDFYRVNQLHSDCYYMRFIRTDQVRNVVLAGQVMKARVFAFGQIETGQLYTWRK